MKYSKKVIAVRRLPVDQMTSFLWTGVNKVTNDDSLSWEKLNIKVPADLVVSSKTEDKQAVYTAKLTFQYCGERYDKQRFIYMVTLANGVNMIIGSDQRPYPVTEINEELSSGDSSSQLIEVAVTYSSSRELARL